MNNIDKAELLNLFSTPVPESDILALMLLLEADSSSSSSSSSDSDHEVKQMAKPKRAKKAKRVKKGISFTKTIDDFDEETFESQMKMKRITAEYLITRFTNSLITEEVTSVAKLKSRCKCKVYIYIWYMTNIVSYGELSELFCVSKSLAWKSVQEVTTWLLTIAHEFINWPAGDAASDACRKFEQLNRIPGVIGVIGCTHFCTNVTQIANGCSLSVQEDNIVTLQAVVDVDNKFTDIYCGKPGGLSLGEFLRSSRIFRKSEARQVQMFPNACYILCNSSYCATNWLMPPFKNEASLTPAQKKFNQLHSNALTVVKDTFVVLKKRFPRISNFPAHRELSAIINIIASACILHNICIAKNDPYKETIASFTSEDILYQHESVEEDIRPTNHRERLMKDLLDRKII